MKLFRRLSQLIRSNINDLIERAEDPQRLLDQMIREMEENLRKAKVEVARAIADEKKLRHQYKNQKERADEWERKAMLAVQKDEDELAREALKRKRSYQDVANGFERQWKEQQKLTNKLRDSLQQLESKVEQARRRKELLVARAKRAEAQKAIHKVMEGMSDQSAFDSFAQLESRVGQMEAEADAAAEVEGGELERKFQELEVGGTLDDELRELKQKFKPKELTDGDDDESSHNGASADAKEPTTESSKEGEDE